MISVNEGIWPVYPSHDKASCFNCGGDFGPDPYWAKSGMPHGKGAFKLDCEKCRVTTWYDLPQREPANKQKDNQQ